MADPLSETTRWLRYARDVFTLTGLLATGWSDRRHQIVGKVSRGTLQNIAAASAVCICYVVIGLTLLIQHSGHWDHVDLRGFVGMLLVLEGAALVPVLDVVAQGDRISAFAADEDSGWGDIIPKAVLLYLGSFTVGVPVAIVLQGAGLA